ncbi:MAG: hypothetical protein MHM6MM_001219 [Cercozoa sp. M6MM]
MQVSRASPEDAVLLAPIAWRFAERQYILQLSPPTSALALTSTGVIEQDLGTQLEEANFAVFALRRRALSLALEPEERRRRSRQWPLACGGAGGVAGNKKALLAWHVTTRDEAHVMLRHGGFRRSGAKVGRPQDGYVTVYPTLAQAVASLDSQQGATTLGDTALVLCVVCMHQWLRQSPPMTETQQSRTRHILDNDFGVQQHASKEDVALRGFDIDAVTDHTPVALVPGTSGMLETLTDTSRMNDGDRVVWNRRIVSAPLVDVGDAHVRAFRTREDPQELTKVLPAKATKRVDRIAVFGVPGNKDTAYAKLEVPLRKLATPRARLDDYVRPLALVLWPSEH